MARSVNRAEFEMDGRGEGNVRSRGTSPLCTIYWANPPLTTVIAGGEEQTDVKLLSTKSKYTPFGNPKCYQFR